ncbi:MAG: hypothetical protein ACHQJ6_06410 [Candidatus Berkiellales bacterium]
MKGFEVKKEEPADERLLVERLPLVSRIPAATYTGSTTEDLLAAGAGAGIGQLNGSDDPVRDAALGVAVKQAAKFFFYGVVALGRKLCPRGVPQDDATAGNEADSSSSRRYAPGSRQIKEE